MAETKPKRSRAKKADAAAPVAEIVAFKGFDKNLQCRGYQYEIGKTHEHTGRVEACSAGLHSCENPLDVLNYYELGGDNRFCRVTASGEIARHDQDSKIASAKLTVDVELRLPDFIKAGVSYLMGLAGDAKGEAVQSASGNSSQLAASGNSSQLAASGNSSQLAASGNSSQLAASGDSSQLAASGNSSQLAASGDSSQLAASGDSSQLAASGYSSQLAASGDSSQLAASGYSSQLEISGTNGVATTAAPGSTVKGVAGTWVSVAEFDSSGECIGFATGKIGDDGIPVDTWLIAKGGKLVTA